MDVKRCQFVDSSRQDGYSKPANVEEASHFEGLFSDEHERSLSTATMKFFAVAAITFASVAVAAPTLEGQTTSIKLSKDYVDAIIAAYPDVHKRDCSFDFSCGCIFCT
ncbi:hypothetical protein K4K61_000602 [Colletotrichum sp. SAR11_59]|nr:hypothetical protein K4K61_000602 [Colletotrichum sp. SAR11_59]